MAIGVPNLTTTNGITTPSTTIGQIFITTGLGTEIMDMIQNLGMMSMFLRTQEATTTKHTTTITIGRITTTTLTTMIHTTTETISTTAPPTTTVVVTVTVPVMARAGPVFGLVFPTSGMGYGAGQVGRSINSTSIATRLLAMSRVLIWTELDALASLCPQLELLIVKGAEIERIKNLNIVFTNGFPILWSPLTI